MAEVTEDTTKKSSMDPTTLEEWRMEMREYDYVRFTWYDMYGCPRSRIVPGRHASRVIPNGFGVYEGALYVGPRSELSHELHLEHLRLLSPESGNVDCVPEPHTLRFLPWAGAGKYKVGEVMCNLLTKDGLPLANLPRIVAQKQLAKLNERGLKVMSAFEIEFILEDSETHKPVFDDADIFSPLFFGHQEKYLYQVDQQLLTSGVNCEMLQTELGPGQFEITMVPVWGIDVGDDAILLKQGLKEIAHQHGLEAIFMSKPDPASSGSGAHFNFSIWKKNADDNSSNAFFDADDDLGLSTFARHWIGGMMAHGRALSALQSPTVNCYRRLHCAWAPNKVFWGIEDRNAALRIKVSGDSGTYMENRLPSSSANHYLVLAATLAAGLDGVSRKLKPPPRGAANAVMLPLDLEEALKMLEEDEVIVESLGKSFVEWFCRLKRMTDLELLKDSDMSKPDPTALAKERHMYSVTM